MYFYQDGLIIIGLKILHAGIQLYKDVGRYHKVQDDLGIVRNTKKILHFS